MGQLKCCQVPKVSTNFTSTIFAPCFFAISITLFGVLIDFAFVIQGLKSRRPAAPEERDTAGPIAKVLRFGVVAFLAVVGDVEAR
jgi:hypothetical protein